MWLRKFRMGQLCAKCVQLLCDFALRAKSFSAGLILDIRKCLAEVLDCPCLKQKSFETRQLYKAAFQTRKEEIAQDFLQDIEKGFAVLPLSKFSLEALKTLAFSEDPGLQMSAAAYYLQLSQYTNISLPPEHLENYYALLKSNDLEVQRISSLSFLNFLLEGNVSKQHVMQTDLLDPVLELLDSDDPTVQCNSCACIMTLAVSDVNQEAIATAGGVVPLLALLKSSNPRVQQNAVGAIFNLTQSEWIQQALFQQGGLPVLICLLESPDLEVQYYSCAALSNMAMNSQHHEAMLHTDSGSLLQTLLPLLSSPADKVSNQACICIRNLAASESVQATIVALPVLPLLLLLLASDNTELQQNAIILLRLLSQHPTNQDKLICDEVLQNLGKLLLAWKTHPVVIGHAACFIKNLSCSESILKITQSPCVEGLLQAVLSADFLEEESLSCVVSCLAELVKHGKRTFSALVRSTQTSFFLILLGMFMRLRTAERGIICILELIAEPLIGVLVRLAGQAERTEVSFQTALIIKCIIQHGKAIDLLKQHVNKIQEYLMKYLSHPEIRFQQLGISTLCLLQKDSEFLSAFSQCQMKKYLEQVYQQTEETQELLSIAIRHMDT